MSVYDTDPEAKAYIDERVQKINEELNPTMNSTDCTADEARLCWKQEKELWREIREKDKEFFLAAF